MDEYFCFCMYEILYIKTEIVYTKDSCTSTTENVHIKGVIHMLETIFLILVIVFSAILQIIIHEAGHLVFGLMTGYRFISFTVLSFRIYKNGDKLSIGKSSVTGAGGQCVMSPAFEESGNIPYFWYNAGGVIFNLFFGASCAGIAIIFNDGTTARTSFMFAAIISLFFVVSNGIPMRTRMIANDAYNILMMLNNPSAKLAFWRVMKINALGASGKKLLDLPQEWFSDLPNNDYSNPLICGFAIDQIYFLLEQREYQKALGLCNEILKTKAVLGIYRNEAICEKQFCEIMVSVETGSKNIVYTLKDNTLKERLDPLTSYHTRYAYAAFILRDMEKSLQTIRKFDIDCQKDSNIGIVEHEKYLFELLSKLIPV